MLFILLYIMLLIYCYYNIHKYTQYIHVYDQPGINEFHLVNGLCIDFNRGIQEPFATYYEV